MIAASLLSATVAAYVVAGLALLLGAGLLAALAVLVGTGVICVLGLAAIVALKPARPAPAGAMVTPQSQAG